MHLQALRHIVLLWLLFLMGSMQSRGQVLDVNSFNQATYPRDCDFRKVFGSDWTAAKHFVSEHHEEWKQEFGLFNVDARLAEAIVFPELIRYSMWQDEIERTAVNGLYVTTGREGADFSIGRFQMKPSFAEEVEKAWNASSLSKEYGFSFNLADNNEARRSRVRRLSDMQGQCRYLAIFIRLQQLRHHQLQQVSQEEQVRLLATAYNRSFTASWNSLRKMQNECHFHTDIIKTRNTRFYCYADIAVAFLSKK